MPIYGKRSNNIVYYEYLKLQTTWEQIKKVNEV